MLCMENGVAQTGEVGILDGGAAACGWQGGHRARDRRRAGVVRGEVHAAAVALRRRRHGQRHSQQQHEVLHGALKSPLSGQENCLRLYILQRCFVPIHMM